MKLQALNWTRFNKMKMSLVLAIILVLTTIMGTGMGSPSLGLAATDKLTIYDDQLATTFNDYSWADHSMSENTIFHGGSKSIRMKPRNDEGLYMYSDRIILTQEYGALELWINGGNGGGQQLEIILQSGGQPVAQYALDASLFEKQIWNKATINLQQLNLPYGIFDGILIRGTTGGSQADVYLDDITLTPAAAVERKLTSISLSQSSLQLLPGQQVRLAVRGTYSDGTTAAITEGTEWKSSNPIIASVIDGTVEAHEAGDTIITVTNSTASVVIPVTVALTEPEEEEPADPSDEGSVGITIYDDSLNELFQDYSWAEHNLDSTTFIHTGTKAIAYNPSNQAGFYLYKGNGAVHVKEYDRLEFWIHGGATGSQEIELVFNAGGQAVGRLNIASLIEGGVIPANSWTKVQINLQDLHITDQIFDGLLFQGVKEGAQDNVYLDDIRLLEKYVAPPTLVEGVLSQYGMVLAPGDSAQVTFEARYSNSTSADMSEKAQWASSNSNVVTVDKGVLTAVGSGLAKITASYGEVNVSLYVQVSSYSSEAVYVDGLVSGYSNWTWGTADFDNTSPVASGDKSISFVATGYQGIWMHRNIKMDLEHYYGLTLKVHGGTNGGQNLRVNMMDGNNFVGDFDLSNLLPDGVPANEWTEIKLKFADLGLTDLNFDGIVVSAWGEADQGTVYFDDISMLKLTSVIKLPAPELPIIQVAIDSTKQRRTLSPGIFGLNFEDMPSDNTSLINVPIKRWGGNQMTRYNWQLDTTNRGGDWYFLNIPNDSENAANLPNGSLSDQFVQNSMNSNTEILLQIPTIGWTPKERTIGWSFSADKYGEQQSNECAWGEAWCRVDAGNGRNPDGSYMTGNDPNDVSKQVGTQFITDWIKHLQGRFGDAVHNYALDNEPMLWGHSHWDVHPEMTTYDEVWEYTQSYGKAIKEADPQANIFGPVPWGWCEYFYSAKDGCSPGEDMASHEGKPYLEWLLGKNEEYRVHNGTRLIDTLDIHYYPAENNIAFSSDESPLMTKRRFNSLKSLYDPNFVDTSSWIQEPVRLIPRMHELIESTSPGMKLSISEYNFGDGNGIGSGLTQAEALALFAREGVDYAMRWGALTADSPLEDAFKLYLDYDGQGSRVEGEVVSTTSSNLDAVGTYTIVSPEGKTFVLLFNKDTAPRQTSLQADLDLNQSAEIYRFEGQKRLYHAGNVQGTSEGLSLVLPAKSATLLVIN